MTDLKGLLEERIAYLEHIISKVSGLNKDIAQLALSDLRTMMDILIHTDSEDIEIKVEIY